MKSKRMNLAGILISLAVLAAACSQGPVEGPPATVTQATSTPKPTQLPPTASPDQNPITVSDDLGVEITLDGPAQRIISISPSLTEILFGVGAGDRLIGRDTNSNYPEKALQAEDLGSMWDGIPVEEILAREPDLVLAGEIFSADAIAELRDLGLNVYWQANPEDFEGLYDNIRDIAVLTGTEDQAETLIEELTARVDAVDESLSDVDEIPLVFYELDASEPANPWTAGAGTFISYLIDRAKGKNLGDSLEGEWVQISSEELIAQNPDIILLADELYGVTKESVAERAGWAEVKAVQTGQIYGFDPFILSVPGPRLVDGYQQLASILHLEGEK